MLLGEAIGGRSVADIRAEWPGVPSGAVRPGQAGRVARPVRVARPQADKGETIR